jgi:hypothetical protein
VPGRVSLVVLEILTCTGVRRKCRSAQHDMLHFYYLPLADFLKESFRTAGEKYFTRGLYLGLSGMSILLRLQLTEREHNPKKLENLCYT